MDRQKMQRQAQILRSKRMARKTSPSVPLETTGHVRLSKPLPRKPKDVTLNPPAAAEARRIEAERILEQRKNIQRRRAGEIQPMNAPANAPAKLEPKKGCSKCGRKKTS